MITTPIALDVVNVNAAGVHRYPARAGVPLPAGYARDVSDLALVGSSSLHPVFQIGALSHWQDGSLKWVLIECLVSLDAGESLRIHVSRGKSKNSSTDAEFPTNTAGNPRQMERGESIRGIDIADTVSSLIVDTGSSIHTFQKQGICLFPESMVAGEVVWAADQVQATLSDSNGIVANFEMLGLSVSPDSGLQRATIAVEGIFSLEDTDELLKVLVEFTFYANTARVMLDVTLHNPAAATHPGGLWDLGDAGSVKFSDFSIKFSNSTGKQVYLQVEEGERWSSACSHSINLFQASSGGEAWASPAHKDASGEVKEQFRGYCVDGLKPDSFYGLRATPTARVTSTSSSWLMKPGLFWQNFPKAINIEDEYVVLRLFPRQHLAGFELQGGEQKRHRTYFDLDAKDTALNWIDSPLQMTIPSTVYSSVNAFPLMDVRYSDDQYDELITNGVDGRESFFNKREAVDEYGWRHFGDLYADHETWNRSDEGIFVSHYNNQYDPIYGFARQFALTGNAAWYVLMQDLANHVMDIDIYRTVEDRAEYNGGYFWHTDHYVEAHTCTHRTFSCQQKCSNGSHNSGGPGGEHCYTTGLTYFYFMTGELRSKQTVLLICDWITRFYEGTGTLLEQVIVLLKQDLPTLRAVMNGGYRFRYRYPLDRGVGNYVNTLLDCLELTDDSTFLARAEKIIEETIGPDDDITERGLENVEETWFYTIFLQALVKFLNVKEQRGDFDKMFLYGRKTLLHYAGWMVTNEKPFLDSPERLEFVNHTWAAQDVRKSAILCAAHYYRMNDSINFRETAQSIHVNALSTLAHSPERHYTRILSILMQNHGYMTILDSDADQRFSSTLDAASGARKSAGHWTALALVRHMIITFFRTARNMSPVGEWRWLMRRLGR